MKHQLTLDYTIPVGDLTPYFEALVQGKALASKCGGCGLVAFPARTQCATCVGKDMQWHPLSGAAQVIYRTDSARSSFALVQFAGADTQSTVALSNPVYRTDCGALIAPPNNTHGLWLELTPDETRNDDVR